MTAADTTVQYTITESFRSSSPTYADRASLTLSPGPRVIRVVREETSDAQPVATWLRRVVTRIEDLTALASRWDSYQAQPVEADTALQAVRFLFDSVDADMPEPSIVPLADGGIQIEWHRGGVDIEVTFSDTTSGIYVEERDTGAVIEESLASAPSLLSRYGSRIANA